MAKKQTKKSRANRESNTLFSKVKSKISRKPKAFVGILTLVSFASVGAFILVQSQAAPDNCQIQDGVPICDVDQTAGNYDSLLSRGSEPQELAKRGWGVYYGAAFRAPAHEYNGAVPITRIYNAEATYHDFVTPVQKSSKEAKYSGKTKNEGVAFYAWRTQVKDTVPVYRLTRAGPHTQTIFSTDKAWVDGLLAKDKNNENGWKKDHLAPFIAFYAYPPNYKVADKPNPYDCSIQENFVSDRCTMQRENLQKEIDKQEAAKKQQEQIEKREEAAESPQRHTVVVGNADKIGDDVCPTAKGDAGLEQYKRGVNELTKKYTTGCHKLWISYAQSKNGVQQAQFDSRSGGNTAKNNIPQGGKGGGGVPVESVPARSPESCPVYIKGNDDENIKYFINNRARLKPNMSNMCAFYYELAANEYSQRLSRFYEGIAKMQTEERQKEINFWNNVSKLADSTKRKQQNNNYQKQLRYLNFVSVGKCSIYERYPNGKGYKKFHDYYIDIGVIDCDKKTVEVRNRGGNKRVRHLIRSEWIKHKLVRVDKYNYKKL